VAQGEIEDGIAQVDDPFASMPKTWRLLLGARLDKTELLADYASLVAQQKAQAAAESEAAPSQTTSAGGSGSGAAASQAASQDFEGDFAMPEFLNEMFGDENAEGVDPDDAAWIKQCKLRMEKRPSEAIRAAAARAGKRRKC
jgi:hypothetical protein